MKKPNLLTILIILMVNTLIGQTPEPSGWLRMMQNGDDYETIVDTYESYYSDPNKQTNEFHYQHYNRWKMFWQNRNYSSPTDLTAGDKGLFYQPSATASHLLFPPPSISGQTICNTSHADSDWQEWGFDDHPPRALDGVFFAQAGMGIVTAVSFDPTDQTNNILYAGTPNAGVWKSSNRGDSWQPLMEELNIPGLSVDDIAINPKNGNNILASTGIRYWRGALPGIGVLQSRNGGVSWEATDLLFQATLQPTKNFIRKVAFHPVDTNKLYAAIDGKLVLSLDHGVTWDSVLYDAPRRQNIYQFKFHPTNPDTMYISTGIDSVNIEGMFLRTYDGGLTWTELQNNINIPFDADFFDFAVTPQAPNNIYATTQQNGPRGYLFRSRDNGDTWSVFSTPFQPTHNYWAAMFKGMIEVSHTDTNIIVVGGIKPYRSTNGGVSFTQIINKMHDDQRSSTMVDGIFAIGTDGGVSISTHPSAETWEYKYSGLNITDFHGHDVDEGYSYLIGGCQDVGINRYDIKDQKWEYVNRSPYGDGGVPLISDIDPDVSFVNVFNGVVGFNDIVRSTDKGKSYFQTNDPNGLSGVNEWHLPTRPIDQDKDGNVYIGYANVYKRHYNSSTWQPLSDFIVDHQKNVFNALSAVAVSSKNPNYIIAAYERPTWNENDARQPCPGSGTCDIKKVFVTTNGGTTWINRSQGLATPLVYNGISDVIFSPKNENHIWITFGQYVGGQRVFFSDDAGVTWSNQSYNLPAVPVNSIIYQPNSNDRLFVATDVGVYTKEGTQTSWECYNENLPTIACTDLDINECANKLTVSTFGRGVWESNLPTVPFNTDGFDTITGTTTWTGIKKFYKNVYVQGDLTIQGTVLMAQGKGIVVAPTYELTIDGGEIDAFRTCNDTVDGFWKGIELIGDYTKSHHWLSVATYHAKLVMKNGATLRNARHGIMQWRAGQYHTAGSLIEIENSNFINCHKAIEFMHHTSEDKSFIKNSNFLLDADYHDIHNDTLKAIPQITLWSVRGVDIIDCNFENNSGYHIFDQYRDHAIFSIDAGYSVVSDCAENKLRGECPGKDNTFKNFAYGVHAINTGSINTVTVDRSEFYDNSISSAFEGVDNVRFTRNLLEAGGILKLNYPSGENYYNLFLEDASGFRVEHNDFEQVASAVHDVTGVYIKNSGQEANEIYYNSFKRFDVGEHYKGVNKHWVSNFQGYQGICNWHPIDGNRDILIDQDGNVTSPRLKQGIRFHQGTDPDKHLDNLWSIAPNTTDGHIKNDADPIWYYHKQNGTPSNPKDEPLYYTSVTVTPKHIPNSVNTCTPIVYQTGQVNGDDPIVVLNDFDLKMLEYDSLMFLYLGTIDGGNSDSMLQTMNLNSNPSAVQLRDQLIAQSPYVSTSTLMQVANSNVLGDLFLLEVCLANPTATQSTGFLDYVEFTIPNPLSSSSVQLIYNNWDTQTGRTIFEQKLAALNGDLGRMFNGLMHYYKTDYGTDRYNDIVALYEKWPSFEHKCRLIELAMERNDYIKTDQIFSDINQNMTLDAWQDDELDNLQDYVDIREGLHNTSRTIWEASPEEISDLRLIADNYSGRASTLANNIACYIYGNCNQQSQLRKKASKERVYIEEQGLVNVSEDYKGRVTISPNPVSGRLSVKLSGDVSKSYQLQFIDLTGRVIASHQLNIGQNMVDMSTIENGSYLAQVRSNGEIIESIKLLVQH